MTVKKDELTLEYLYDECKSLAWSIAVLTNVIFKRCEMTELIPDIIEAGVELSSIMESKEDREILNATILSLLSAAERITRQTEEEEPNETSDKVPN
jgi:hypothetical protein